MAVARRRRTDRRVDPATRGPSRRAICEMWPELVGSVLRLAVVQPSAGPPLAQDIRRLMVRHERALRLAEGESQGESNGAPGRIRTCGLWLRRPTLYPAELRARTRRS